MESFPGKIYVGVFVTTIMPGPTYLHPKSRAKFALSGKKGDRNGLPKGHTNYQIGRIDDLITNAILTTDD
ncbi:hypothetical protein LguiA_027436 [Lonicera macranthoides]